MSKIFGVALTWFLSEAIARVLIGAGLSIVTITWLESSINGFLTDAASMISQGSADVVGLVGLGGIWVAMSTIGSALIMRAVIVGASNVVGLRKT